MLSTTPSTGQTSSFLSVSTTPEASGESTRLTLTRVPCFSTEAKENTSEFFSSAAAARSSLSSSVKANGLTPQAAQLSVSETKGAGGLHLLQANNPVFLIAGGGND